MSNFLLLLILFVLASVLLLIVYLIDRVNIIEKVTLKFTGDAKIKEGESTGVFAGLEAEKLWGAMNGLPTEGWDKEALDEIRPRYEVILQKHAEALFEAGVLDGKEGLTKPPGNIHSVNTLRGAVNSWVPQQYADAIYEAGNDRSKTDGVELPIIRNKLDEAYSNMLNQVSLTPSRPISEQLLPLSMEIAPPSAEGGEIEQDEKRDRLAEAINEELNTQEDTGTTSDETTNQGPEVPVVEKSHSDSRANQEGETTKKEQQPELTS